MNCLYSGKAKSCSLIPGMLCVLLKRLLSNINNLVVGSAASAAFNAKPPALYFVLAPFPEGYEGRTDLDSLLMLKPILAGIQRRIRRHRRELRAEGSIVDDGERPFYLT